MKKHPYKENMPQCSTREQAQELGSPIFFTGKPCRNGHVSTRRAATGACSACRQEQQRKSVRGSHHAEDYLSRLGRNE